MVEKLLAWCGNVLLASVLVMLASQNLVFAQDGDKPVETIQPSGRISVPLSGTAAVRMNEFLTASPGQLEMGSLAVGENSQKTLTLSHVGSPGSPAVVINDAVLFGKSAAEFRSDFNGFTTLNAGDSVQVLVTFSPTEPGTKSAGLRLSIEGATAPTVLLFSGDARFPLTSDLKVADKEVKFGTVIEGKSVTKNIVLKNDGVPDAPAITISTIELGGDTPQAFDVQFTPTTIAPGEQVEVPVTMNDPNAGTKTAQVLVLHDGINPSIEMEFAGEVVAPGSIPVNFGKSTLNTGTQIDRGTAIEFGPDGKLYVATMHGPILVFDVKRNGANNYSANLLETINLVRDVPNHDDKGNPVARGNRQVTGIFLTGTADAPVIYVASSDPVHGAGPSDNPDGNDKNLDTNSGMLHKLTKTGGVWKKQDLVRGLPRSEENHSSNGLLLKDNKILLMSGGNTNQGSPSTNFAQTPEYALSGALLEIDLGAIGGGTYDLPTLNDPESDANDPFGGNDGKNQAKLVQGGPVQLYATGFRNAYDVVLTEAGNLYTFDNGPNNGWGGTPGADCSNDTHNFGDTHSDSLHKIDKGGYYGHPNPTRGNKGNTWNGQSPIEGNANPEECVFKTSQQVGALSIITGSTNGIDEYTANNFLSAMQGNLVVVSFDKSLYRLQLNGSGTAVTSKSKLASNLGTAPLDVTSQGSGDVFPGTIWVVDNLEKIITVFEPSDY